MRPRFPSKVAWPYDQEPVLAQTIARRHAVPEERRRGAAGAFDIPRVITDKPQRQGAAAHLTFIAESAPAPLRKTNAAEQGLQVRLYTSGPKDSVMINAASQIGAQHRFSVARPISLNCRLRGRSAWWSMAGPVRQMVQQHGLKTGVLLEDVNSVVGCKLERACVTLQSEADLIVIQKREALLGRLPLFLEQSEAHQCHEANR